MLAQVTSESNRLYQYQLRRIRVQVHELVESGVNSVRNEPLKIPD